MILFQETPGQKDGGKDAEVPKRHFSKIFSDRWKHFVNTIIIQMIPISK